VQRSQSKPRKHGKSAYLRISLYLPITHSQRGAKTLSDIINSCRDNYRCPFVIHRHPERRGEKMAAEKQHIIQLTGDDISKGFAHARNLSGICKEDENPPPFHELLSLG
jgi:hypothetical protein